MLSSHRGYSLLLAVLLTSVMIVSASALARVVILNLRQVQNIDRAMVAYSAADSGIEKTLFLARKTEEDLLAGETEEVIDEARVKITVQEAGEASFKIAANDFAVLDLPMNHSLTEMKINAWSPNCLEGAASWLEVNVAAWRPESGFEQISRHPYSLNDFSDPSASVSISLPPSAAQVRLKPLYCDIAKITVQGLKGNSFEPMPSRLVIKAVGEYRGVKQAIQAAILKKNPLAGLFDFAIFSECPLVKGEESRCQ